MSMQQTRRWCSHCQRYRLCTRQEFNLHDSTMVGWSMLTLCSCGLLFPVFLLVITLGNPWRCSHCGNKC